MVAEGQDIIARLSRRIENLEKQIEQLKSERPQRSLEVLPGSMLNPITVKAGWKIEDLAFDGRPYVWIRLPPDEAMVTGHLCKVYRSYEDYCDD